MADLHQKRIFRVLGPLEVFISSDGVPITSTRQGIILATLLMTPNRVATLDMLIEAIWDGRPPVTARRQVQICVSVLRRVIGVPNNVETCVNGYRIVLRPEELDYSCFVDALNRSHVEAERGDFKQAVATLDAALDLWRGPALAGLPGRAAETMALHLEELRSTAIEARIELRLALGEHYELAGELVAATASYPLRERLWKFRMLAMYRAGRQAEALNIYQAARRVLVEELGLEPGNELRQLERAILAQDPGLLLADDSDAARVRRPGDCAGHGELVHRLQEVVDSFPDGQIFVIAFDDGADERQLAELARAVPESAIVITSRANRAYG